MTTEKFGPEYDYCGIVFIGGGSSWSYAATPEDAAEKAAKRCKRDWKHMYKFKRKQPFVLNVYDTKEVDGWYADYEGVFDKETNEKVPLVGRYDVEV